MATFSHTIGSGGDYAGWSAWQTARIASGDAGSGDVEEAVFLDGVTGGNLELSNGWPSGVTVRMRAENPHLGDWDVDIQGHRINAGGNGYGIRLAGALPNNLTFEIEDMVLSGSLTNSFRHGLAISSTSGTGVTVAVRRCLITSGPVSDSHGVILGNIASNIDIIFDNCCGIGESSNGAAIVQVFNTCNATLYIQSSYLSKLIIVYNSAGSFNWVVDGSILGQNPGNATSRVATDSINAANWTGWSTTNCAVASLVSGTPGSGEVGFEDISANDYRLVDHPDNLAIDYVVNASVPSYDILGNSRDATPDCGPFEVIATGDTSVTPGAASLTLTPQTPTVTATANISVTPGRLEMALTAYAPTVTAGVTTTVTPGAGELAITGHAPTVTATADVTVTPDRLELTATTFAPTVTVTSNQTVTPGRLELALTTYAPTVTASVGVSLVQPGVAELTLTLYAPDVSTTAPVTVVTDGAPEGLSELEAVGVYQQRVALAAGDEWFITLSGPSADAPRARVVVRFRE